MPEEAAISKLDHHSANEYKSVQRIQLDQKGNILTNIYTVITTV